MTGFISNFLRRRNDVCAVAGMDPPCSKCGAPALWRQKEEERKKVKARLLDALDYANDLSDDCPIKSQILEILNAGN